MVRKMGQYEVSQRTKDGMFNATALSEQWKKRTGVQKDIGDFLRLSGTKEFIEILYLDVNKSEMGDSPDRVTVGSVEGIISKTRAKAKPKGGSYPGEVWFHPYLFLDFAMWLNPRFRLDVIKFVYDQLIEFRHDAGNHYKGLTSALTTFQNVDYAKVAMGLNYIVFGHHEKDLRQYAKPDELKKLSQLQKQLAFAVNMGYIRTFDQFLNEMRRIWKMRYTYILM